MKSARDIWTNCLTCHFAFLARSSDELYCPDCKAETKELSEYDRDRWKE